VLGLHRHRQLQDLAGSKADIDVRVPTARHMTIAAMFPVRRVRGTETGDGNRRMKKIGNTRGTHL
jgi:hypothetical protein